jgi:cytochrome P450
VFTWNAWSIALSEKEYEDPERFWPERWLGGEKGRGLEDPLEGHWAFGAGM